MLFSFPRVGVPAGLPPKQQKGLCVSTQQRKKDMNFFSKRKVEALFFYYYYYCLAHIYMCDLVNELIRKAPPFLRFLHFFFLFFLYIFVCWRCFLEPFFSVFFFFYFFFFNGKHQFVEHTFIFIICFDLDSTVLALRLSSNTADNRIVFACCARNHIYIYIYIYIYR